MKNLLFNMFLIIIYGTYQVQGQEFAPVGTIWTYGYGTSSSWPIQYEPYYLEVKEEVEFNNKLCKSIVKTSYKGESEEVDLLYQDGEQVYFYNEELDSFLLLFDFGAEQYDTIQIGLDRYYNEEEPPYIEIIIDSIGFETYFGEELKVWYLSNSNELHHYYFDSKVIERIGFLHSFHPVSGLFCGDIGSLRCFESTNYSCKLVDFDCDTVYFTSNLNKVDIENNLKIFPNPVSSEINIHLPEQGKFSSWNIYNMAGQKIESGQIVFSQKFNSYLQILKISSLENLDSGVYFIQLLKGTNAFISNYSHTNQNNYLGRFLKY